MTSSGPRSPTCVRARSSTGPRSSATCAQRLPHLEGDFSVRQFPNGSANLTYLVRFGDDALVVRRPPFGMIAAGAHDMLREYTVLSRLHAAYPRAPLGLHYCADPAVIGAHFLVSEYRPGVVVWDRVPEALAVGPEPGRRIGFAVVDALADLHLVDPAGLRPRLPRPPRRLPGPAGPGLAAPLGGGRDRGPRHRRPGRRAPRPAPARVRPARPGPQRLQGRQLPVQPGRPRRGDLGLRLGHGDARRPADRPGDAAELLAGRRDPRRGSPRRRERRAAQPRRGRRALRRADPAAADPRGRRVVRGVRLLEDRDHHAAALRPAPPRRDLRRTHDHAAAAGGPHRRPRPGPRQTLDAL